MLVVFRGVVSLPHLSFTSSELQLQCNVCAGSTETGLISDYKPGIAGFTV